MASAQQPEQLFRPHGLGDEVVPGWTLDSIERPAAGAIYLKLTSGESGEHLRVRLTRSDREQGAYCRTTNFNLAFLGDYGGQTPEPVARAMLALCALVEANDTGALLLPEAGPTCQPGEVTVGTGWAGWPELLTLLLGLWLAWLALTWAPLRLLAARCSELVERYPWVVVAAVMLPLAWLRLAHLDLPFDADYMTQRVMFGSLDIGDILAHRYHDQRHPQLFYLVLHFFLHLGHQEWLARLPAALFSLTAMLALWRLAAPLIGHLRAILALVVFGLSLAVLQHSRDVSDITLFLTLALLAMHMLLRLSSGKPRPRQLALFVLAQAAMLYTYYLALVVVAAQLVLLLAWRRRVSNRVWLAMGAGLLLALPALVDFASLMWFDMKARRLAAQFPAHFWGELAPADMLGQLWRLLFPGGELVVAAVLLWPVGLVRWAARQWRQPGFWLFTLSTLALVATAAVSVLLVRMKPYYMLLLVPLLACTQVVGALGLPGGDQHGWRQRLGHALGWGLVALLVHLHLAATLGAWPQITSSHNRDAFARAGEVIRSQPGPYTVVADPDMLHTIMLYYAFPRPLEMYRGCSFNPGPVSCELGGYRFQALTAMTQMSEGWELRAVERLRALGDRPFWFVYTTRFSNRPLRHYLEQRCRLDGTWDPLLLYWCSSATTREEADRPAEGETENTE